MENWKYSLSSQTLSPAWNNQFSSSLMVISWRHLFSHSCTIEADLKTESEVSGFIMIHECIFNFLWGFIFLGGDEKNSNIVSDCNLDQVW